jgi:GNAT superfamily N-acetyltransferase
VFRRVLEFARAHGVRALIVAVWRRAISPVYRTHKVTVVVNDLDNVVKPKKLAADLKVEALGREHLPSLSELNRVREEPEADALFLDNLDRGLFGSVGLRGGEVVAYVWWVDAADAHRHRDLAWLGPALDLGPKDLYSSDTYVLPDQRGGGTATSLLYGAELELHERGYKRVFGFIDEGNEAALRFWPTRGYFPTQVVERRWIFSRESVRLVGE